MQRLDASFAGARGPRGPRACTRTAALAQARRTQAGWPLSCQSDLEPALIRAQSGLNPTLNVFQSELNPALIRAAPG
jgi:hypothetical protein